MSSRMVSTGIFVVWLAVVPLAAQPPGDLPAPPSALKVKVSALLAGAEPLETTDHVRWSSIATLLEQPMVAVGLELEPGDELFSIDDEVALELTCPRGTLLRFSGAFKVLIKEPGARDCAVNFLRGTVDVLGDQPTEIEAAGALLGPKGTEYGCAVGDEDEWRLWVYDGAVQVSGSDERWQPANLNAEARLVTAGRVLAVARGGLVENEIGFDRRVQSASLAARFDVGKAVLRGEPIADAAVAIQRLERLHLVVLGAPADPVARADLARVQLELRAAPQAVYNLERAGIQTEQQLRQYKIDPGVLRSLPTVKSDALKIDVHKLDLQKIDVEKLDQKTLDPQKIDVKRIDADKIKPDKPDVSSITGHDLDVMEPCRAAAGRAA